MAFFREETEVEKEKKKIIKYIRNSSLNYEWIRLLEKYVNDIYDGIKDNDFGEMEYLIKIISMIIDKAVSVNQFNAEIEFGKILEFLNKLLPEGKETNGYLQIINIFVNNFKIDEDGFVNGRHFNVNFYNLFENKIIALNLLNSLNDGSFNSSDVEMIFQYAIEVSPYCNNQNILFLEINSFINSLRKVLGDKVDFYKTRLEDVKKRVGIYPLDEKSLAFISAEAEKAQELIRKLEVMQRKIGNYQERIKYMTDSGKKEIKESIKFGQDEIRKLSDDAIKNMQSSIDEYVKGINHQLDEYLLELEQSMKESSDQVFNGILAAAQKRINEIKVMAQRISTNTSSELVRIQQATDDSISSLNSYLESEPRLQELLKKASDSEEIRAALLKFSASEKDNTGMDVLSDESSPAGVIIPGYDRLVVPANPKVIIPPDGFKSSILPAFDESIPFETRYKRIIEEKNKREQMGEIYHAKMEEALIAILEGEWPYLWGPSGCGKSHVIRQIAELIGIEMIDNGKITDKYSVMAYNDPHGRFRATQAFVAFAYGKLLLLDEFDNGNTDTQVIFNELYSASLDVIEKPGKKRYVTFAEDMTVPINPNFRMISAGNTSGEGENQIFSSRGKIDESVQERMTPIYFNYDNRIEEKIFGEYVDWYDFFIKFRKACDEFALKEGLDVAPGMATTRDASSIVRSIKHNSKSVEQLLRHKFVQTKGEEYLRFLMDRMRNFYDLDDSHEDSRIYPLDDVKSPVLAKKFIKECERSISSGRRI